MEKIAVEFDISPEETEEHLRQLQEDHLVVLQPDTSRILFVNPLSSVATNFKVKDLDTNRGYFANCGWDAVAIHFMIKHPIQIETNCPQTLEPITLRVENGRITERSHPGALVYLTMPARKWWDNVIETCGRHMMLYSSKEAAEEYAKAQGLEGYGLSDDQLYGLCSFLYDDKLDLDYRRPTKEETVATFERLGLTGDFWQT